MLGLGRGKIRTLSEFCGFNIDPKDFVGYDVDLYSIMVIGQERKPWRMSNDYKHIMIRMTRPGQIDRCRSDAGVCVAMLQANYERTSRKHYTTRMDDKGSWVYVCELMKRLAAELEACIAEGKETAIFFKEDPEDTYSCHTTRPLIRITREEFFAEDVDPQSGVPAANMYRKDKAFFLHGEHVKAEKMTLPGLKASPTDFKRKMTQKDLGGMEIPLLGTFLEDMSLLFAHLSGIEQLCVMDFRLKGGKNMKMMFRYCKSLRRLDLAGLDTSQVTDMSYMFEGCRALTALDLSGFDTSKVKYMSGMFTNCASLEALDLSGFDFSRVTSMDYMFSGCDSLREVIFSDTVKEACQGKIRSATGRTCEAETWNPLDAHTRQQAEIQGIIYKTTVPEYTYSSPFGTTEEKRRKYFGLGPDVKITIVPHRAR